MAIVHPSDSACPATSWKPFQVVAVRIDSGARWMLEVPDLPGVRAQVRDLFDGAATVRAVIADAVGRDGDEIEIAITLG